MKRILSKQHYLLGVIGILCLLFAGVSHALAQTDTTTTTPDQTNGREERMEERAEVREDRIEARTERVELRRTALEERVQNRISNLATNVIRKMSAAVDRLEQISERFDARITILKDRGVDTTEAETLLDSANDLLTNASAKLVDLPEAVEDAITNETPREAFALVKAEFQAVRDDIKAAHGYLRQALAALKTAVAEAELGRGVSDAVTDAERPAVEEEEEEAETTE